MSGTRSGVDQQAVTPDARPMLPEMSNPVLPMGSAVSPAGVPSPILQTMIAAACTDRAAHGLLVRRSYCLPASTTDVTALIAQLPFELAQEFGVVPVADEGSAIAVATAPHMTVASLSAVRQQLGWPLRAQAVPADEFRRG